MWHKYQQSFLDTFKISHSTFIDFIQVKNYDNEVALDPSVDILSLYTLRQLTRMADDYFEDQMEEKGYYDDDEKWDAESNQ